MDSPRETPDFKPLYAQIRELLLARLADGRWRPGDPIPAEPRLAAEFGVSQGTVRKALDQLAEMHLVVRRQGKGTFVAQHTPDRALFHFFHIVGEDGDRRLPESRVVATRRARASRDERRALDLAGAESVLRIQRVRTLDGQPVIVERICLPADLFPGLDAQAAAALPNTLYALYEQTYQVPVASAEERLRAVAADAHDARLLGVTPGVPLLEIDRVARSHGARPVEWRVSRLDTTHHHYHNHLV